MAARGRLRAAIVAKKHAILQDCLAQVDDPAMAAALRRQVERCGGLSPAARQDILRDIQSRFPKLWALPTVEPWEDTTVLYVTSDGMTGKHKELDELINVKMHENAKAIGEAASKGDLSENSEYQFALEERDLLRARVAQIQNQMAAARVMTASDVVTDRVSIGTRVVLTDASNENQMQITILGPWEADVDKAIYNYQAPFCKAVLGHKIGETVTLSLEGEERDYRIEDISAGIER
jgi:transcription elongation factor GreA